VQKMTIDLAVVFDCHTRTRRGDCTTLLHVKVSGRPNSKQLSHTKNLDRTSPIKGWSQCRQATRSRLVVPARTRLLKTRSRGFTSWHDGRCATVSLRLIVHRHTHTYTSVLPLSRCVSIPFDTKNTTGDERSYRMCTFNRFTILNIPDTEITHASLIF
jgi:hypothetical protein